MSSRSALRKLRALAFFKTGFTQQQDKQTTHNNASLSADNLNIVTTGDANIIGGNLHGGSSVYMDIGGDLLLESVQDRFSGSSKGFGISGGISLGGVFTNENGAAANSKEVKTTQLGATDGVSGVNGGVNASNGRYQTTETVLSSITGGSVNIDVNGHTQLTGALIAALDEEGNDTGNLSLNTGSLTFTDLSNRSYSSNQSFGVSGSVGIGGKENPGDPNQTNINSSNYSYQNQSSQSLDKTLATIGQGSITVGGQDATPEGLNRDVDNINKEIYAVDRQQGNIDLTVDHRLLTEEGRKQIAEDAKRTQILGSSIADLAQAAVSLTGSGEGEDSLRDHIGNKQDYFTATKNFTQNTANTEHVATLANPNATPEQKQAAYTALVNEIATYLGVDPTEAKVLMENDPQFAGAFSRDTDTVYVNDLAHNNATDAVNTVGHETQHYLDNQQNPDAVHSDQYEANREEYAGIMGDATADYLGFNFAQNGSSLASGNNHSLGSNADEAMRNLGLVTGNNAAYGAERPEALDNRYLNPEERKLAEQLAKDSGGRFTTQEMLDALRHARPAESTDYPQGMNENVLDTALATDETLKYLDGSEGRLIVTPDENGDARYIVQDMGNIPLNEDAKEYIKQQGLGYSFIEQVERTESLPVFRDMLTGKPLDDSGRYMMGYDVDGNVYNVPHYSCATADCLSQKLNIDWNSPEGQAYQNALSAKALDDVSTAATGILLFTPPGALATGLGYLSLGASVGSGYLQDDLLKTTVSETSSFLYETALKEKFGKTLGGRINTGLSLIGIHDGIGSFVSDVSKVVTETPSGSSDSSKSNDVSKRESGE